MFVCAYVCVGTKRKILKTKQNDEFRLNYGSDHHNKEHVTGPLETQTPDPEKRTFYRITINLMVPNNNYTRDFNDV